LFQKDFRKRIDVKASDVQITSLDEKLIQKAIKCVEDRISDPDFSVEDLSRELGMSRVHLYKKLQALTGKSPLEFIRNIRLQHAAQLLEKSQLTVSEVAYKVGFNNPKYFVAFGVCFVQTPLISPVHFRSFLLFLGFEFFMRNNFVLILIYLAAGAVITSCDTQSGKLSMFTQMPSGYTGIKFQNTLIENERDNILTYEYFYNGGAVAAGDINNDGLVDLYFTANQGENKLYLNKGNFQFEDITAHAGVSAANGWRTGVSMADVNGDGLLDIYVCRSGDLHPLFRTNLLFINNGDLTFSERAAEYGLDDDSYSTQGAWFDYDRDGDLDLFLLNHSRLTISNAYDISKRYTGNRVRYVGNELYRNDNGKFKKVGDETGIFGPASNYGLGIAFSDLNNDGWADIYITNDYTEKDKVFINQHGKYFLEVSDSLLTHMSQFSMGVDIGDINNDGWADIITLDMLPDVNERQKEFYWPDRYDVYTAMVRSGLHHQYMRNMLHLNNGDGTFSEIGQFSGISNTDWSWASLIADFDNDGLQDLFVSNGFKRNFTSNDFLRYKADRAVKARNGIPSETLQEVLSKMPSNAVHNFMFRNTTGIAFADVSTPWGFSEETLTHGVVYADLDNDGDLDLVVNNTDREAGIYRNNAEQFGPANFIKVMLQGNNSNTFGVGAKVMVYSEGVGNGNCTRKRVSSLLLNRHCFLDWARQHTLTLLLFYGQQAKGKYKRIYR
jgi:enediyne biosynthesis protein E4